MLLRQGIDDQAGHGCDVHDIAVSLLQHPVPERAAHEERARQIDADDLLPDLQRHLLGGSQLVDAGVVDQNVKSVREDLPRLLRKAQHVFFLRDIRLQHRAIYALGAHSGLRFRKFFFHQTRDDDIRTCRGQPLCNFQPDAALRAGHEGGLALQTEPIHCKISHIIDSFLLIPS